MKRAGSTHYIRHDAIYIYLKNPFSVCMHIYTHTDAWEKVCRERNTELLTVVSSECSIRIRGRGVKVYLLLFILCSVYLYSLILLTVFKNVNV